MLRKIVVVPDLIASAGGVIDGIGETVMGLSDRGSLIDQIGVTAMAVVSESISEKRNAETVAESLAWQRLERGW